MADFRLDRIRFKWKGVWAATTDYVKDDVVRYAGTTYVCKKGHTASSTFETDIGVLDQEVIVTVGRNFDDTGNVYYFNGEERPILYLRKGITYTFNLDDLTNVYFPNANGTTPNPHPFHFSKTEDGTLINSGFRYEDGVRYYLDKVEVSATDYINNFSTAIYREIRIDVAEDAIPLYYFCQYHQGMGNSIDVSNDVLWEKQIHGGVYKGAWQTGVLYDLNDIVTYGGKIYVCTHSHTSDSDAIVGLEGNISSWKVYSSEDDWKGNWVNNYRYRLNDVVKNNGTLYRCIEEHVSAETVDEGIESDIAKWEIVFQQISFLQDWQAGTNYKIFDLVKVGASVWKCESQHISESFADDYAHWSLYLDGLEWENQWDIDTFYQIGDTVDYGGYSYRALLSNTGVKPEAENSATWQQVYENYDHQGDYSFDSTREYKVGDLVRHNGYLYVAILDNEDVIEPPSPTHWKVVVPGRQWRGQWLADEEYKLEDLATIGSNTYICNEKHLSTALNRPDVDSVTWSLHAEGKSTNVMTTKGDLITYANDPAKLNKQRFARGNAGQILRVQNSGLDWEDFDLVTNVFYVSVDGRDLPENGKSLNSPFRTIKYACQFIQDNVDVENENSTIFVKTGIYEENIPISVPENCSIQGDELRSTVVQPVQGSEAEDMFYVRNASNLKNLTLQGLFDVLAGTGDYLTRRPALGPKFVSLDPGTGPDDQSVWIKARSPYVQNCTTLGTGAVGIKIDGSLHNGGNDSIVANDFTQVISDGIGVWCTNLGRTELVSVFTYYNHIGYLAENGGKIRGTNGNNSYGDYGSVAEGVDDTETPITATTNNRSQEAIVSSVVTDGDEVLVVEYSNAGENYDVNTSYTVTGAGSGATATTATVKDGGIFQVRLTGGTPYPLGTAYLTVQGNAQDGAGTGQIVLSGADINSLTEYAGMRIVIISGAGAGQYAYVNTYDNGTKIMGVLKESDDTAGWDHFVPGTPIVNPDSTSRYQIEPRVIVDAPESGDTAFIRLSIVGGGLGEFKIIDPGSGYNVDGTPPDITIVDPNRTTDGYWEVRVGNGVLGQPNWTSRGSGYISAFVATVSGAGYSDEYPLGAEVVVSGLTRIPGPGANLNFAGVDQLYSVVDVQNITGTPGNESATLLITPYLKAETTVGHNTAITIRESYSQVRLTGHDFLDIGTGSQEDTEYPNRYIFGYTSLNNPSQPNEAVQAGGGRVFYTSTDQDGNFRVGELFKVEQATGVITLNADDFQLSGLTELRLGGVVLGGTSAVIREFSTDGTLAANSDNIIPTQKAIATYIEKQIGGGGADVVVSGLIAGQTNILNGNEISSPTEVVDFNNQVNFTSGVLGDMLQATLFMTGNG